MDNVRKNPKNSLRKNTSGPLILTPPKVMGQQHKYMESKEELDDSEHSEHEKERAKSEYSTIADDTLENHSEEEDNEEEEDDEDLPPSSKEAASLPQSTDSVKENIFNYQINESLKDHFFYQPKNRYGSFFYIKTTSEEDDDELDDDTLNGSAHEESFTKQDWSKNEVPHESFTVEEKTSTTGESDEKKPFVADLEKEKESLTDDDMPNEQTGNVLEKYSSLMPDSMDDEPLHEPEEDIFAPGETDDKNPFATDLEEMEHFINDDIPAEETKAVLEESIGEDNSLMPDSIDDGLFYESCPIAEETLISENPNDEELLTIDSQDEDEPSHDSYPIEEETLSSGELSYEDLSAIDSHEEEESAFFDENQNEQAQDAAEDWKQEEPFHDSSRMEEKNAVCEDEHLQEKHSHGKSKLPSNQLKKSPSPIVKLPVLLAVADIDLDIFDSFDLAPPISNVIKVDWAVQCLEGRVLLPSTTVFLKGILVATIEYVNENQAHSLQQVKVQVPWRKSTNVEWIYTPVMPGSRNEEYTFQCPGGGETSLHREHHEQFVEQIQFELCRFDHTWNEELVTQAGASKLLIQGSANLSINFLQPQYVALHST